MAHDARPEGRQAISCICFACLPSVATFLIPNFKAFDHDSGFQDNMISIIWTNALLYQKRSLWIFHFNSPHHPQVNTATALVGPSELERGKRD